MSGEMLMATGYGLVLIVGGLFVWISVRRFFDDKDH